MYFSRFALLLIIAYGAASASGQAFLPATMSEAFNASLYLARFEAAVREAGYTSMFDNPDFNGTVFAPCDSAFPQVAASEGGSDSDQAVLNATVNTSAMSRTIAFHIVPGLKAFPLGAIKQGTMLPTLVEGRSLYIDKTVPGIVHVYGNDPKKEPANFGTILQYQEIKGGKAIMYVLDKILKISPGP